MHKQLLSDAKKVLNELRKVCPKCYYGLESEITRDLSTYKGKDHKRCK